MDNNRLPNNQIQIAFKVAFVFALASVAFLTIFKYDNKYTSPGPQALNGTLTLSRQELESNPVIFLVDGWEYYAGRLLTPSDFQEAAPKPDEYIFIGSLGGFEKWNSGLPHGSASYRLRINLPAETASYMLELPEIFSAYRLYVNGVQVMQMGEPEKESYIPQTGNRTVSIEGGGHTEILFAVSDFSHLYSGMVYPPAFGHSHAVATLLNSRLVLRSLLCAASITISILSLMVGLLARRNSLTVKFGLLCIFFVGYVGYPITNTVFSEFQLKYVIENLAFCLVLLLTMLIAAQVSKFPVKWQIPFMAFAGGMCVFSLILHILLPLGNLKIMLFYSRMISAYEWICAGFTVFTIHYAIKKGNTSVAPILYGVVVFACSLLADRLLPLYEPILTGWFIEIASFVLILSVGSVTATEVAARYRESAVMNERAGSMERLYKSQLSYFQALKQESEQTKTMRHDLRHHITLIDSYVTTMQYGKLEEYVKEYRKTYPDDKIQHYCPIEVIDILTHHYHNIAKQNQIDLDIRCNFKASSGVENINMPDSDLCCLYSNMLENALEACMRLNDTKRYIKIAIFSTSSDEFHIQIRNSAENVKQVGTQFFSLKNDISHGYGLLSIKSIALKYNGSAEFIWNADSHVFESHVTVKLLSAAQQKARL